MMPMGWICPRCQTVHAPNVKQCSCRPQLDVYPPKDTWNEEKSKNKPPRVTADGWVQPSCADSASTLQPEVKGITSASSGILTTRKLMRVYSQIR